MINSKILLDSVSPGGHRLTTYQLEYPRFIHAQVLTHRVFSRNAQSSRAMPTTKLINRMLSNPVRPVRFGENQPGMVAGKELSKRHSSACRVLWDRAMWQVLDVVKDLQNFDVHKEVINRLLEPWCTISVILTGTEFSNFFDLRCNYDSQPEIQQLATAMKEQYETSNPEPVACDLYHLPLVDVNSADMDLEPDVMRKVSVARCARVSYCNHDGVRSVDDDIALYDRLLESRHLSPFEHVARPTNNRKEERNFAGWVQHRTEIENDTK